MPRALVVTHASVAAAEREGYLRRSAERKRTMSARGCNFWVYEDPAAPGSFTEFTEARDATTLRAALGGADDAVAAAPILTEVELP